MSPRPRTFRGLAISSGKVVAQVCVFSVQDHRSHSTRTLQSQGEIDAELERYRAARTECSSDLELAAQRVARSVGQAESEIFRTQRHILNDPALNNEILSLVTEKQRNIEAAVFEVYLSYEDRIARLHDDYFRQRSSDISEIRQRLLDKLLNTQPGFSCRGQHDCRRGHNRIIVAEELTADMMVHMDLEKVLGIVTEHGGTSSHAAIIARSVGVPAVTGLRGIYGTVDCGSRLLLDGDTGMVIVDPDQEMVDQLLPAEPVVTDAVCHLTSPPGTRVMANASLLEDVRQAAQLRADGIGLFRTEIMFMQAGRPPTEQEQFEYYSAVVAQMGEGEVTFRLVDIGGDKDLPFLSIEKETNPYLGYRGSRFLLGNQGLFSSQVRALLRLSALTTVNIMFPMVVDSLQLERLTRFVRDLVPVIDGVRSDKIRLGAMLEVPSACLQAAEILKRVDFASIGSNDLIQYLFAVDRNNELVSHDYNPHHPVLWEMLASMSARARELGKPLSICGEMAGRENIPGRLVSIGISTLSVGVRLVPRVRNELALQARRAVASMPQTAA